MGYTHYWYEKTIPARIPHSAVRLIGRIIDKAQREGLIQREWNDPRKPIVTDRRIQFNGVGEDGHETFFYDLNEPCQRQLELLINDN